MDQGPSLAEAAVLLWVPVCLCALALLVVLAAQRRRQLKHGVVLYSDRPSQSLRRWALTVPLLAIAVLVVVTQALPVVPALGALAVALLVWWRLPSPKDATLGQNGVGRGFEGRAWSELEEWRLTGEHLRFRLHGEWTSAPCPVDDQPRVRAWLVQACPERESRFQD